MLGLQPTVVGAAKLVERFAVDHGSTFQSLWRAASARPVEEKIGLAEGL
jgi:hypothetical protein